MRVRAICRWRCSLCCGTKGVASCLENITQSPIAAIGCAERNDQGPKDFFTQA
jgi:hypothetical protein